MKLFYNVCVIDVPDITSIVIPEASPPLHRLAFPAAASRAGGMLGGVCVGATPRGVPEQNHTCRAKEYVPGTTARFTPRPTASLIAKRRLNQ